MTIGCRLTNSILIRKIVIIVAIGILAKHKAYPLELLYMSLYDQSYYKVSVYPGNWVKDVR